MARTWPFVARDAELRAGAVAVRAGAGAVLTGPAGVGRTRLLHAVAAAVDPRRHAVLRLRPAAGARATFAPLLDGRRAAPGDVERALRRRAGHRRAVLCIDDAHLLDEASAAVVAHLLRRRAAVPLLAVRTGAATSARPEGGGPAALTGVERPARRLAVHPLGPDALGQLLTAALGDVVDRAAVLHLHHLIGGDLVLLRELVRRARRTGALERVHGVWQYHGDGPVAPGLRGLVESRLAGLPGELRAAQELVALADPLDVALLDALGVADAVVELERRGLVELHADGVRPAHTLHGDATRAACPPLRTRQHFRRLAAALGDRPVAAAPGAPRPPGSRGAAGSGELLRLATWRLAGGLPVGVEVLVGAAREALALGDVRSAERLARAAAADGASVAAVALLAQVLLLQADPEGAAAALAAATAVPRDDHERFALASTRLAVLGDGLEDGDGDLGDDGGADLADPALREAWSLQRAMAHLGRGRPDRAEPLLGPLLEPPGPGSPAVRIGARAAAGALLLVRGATDEAAALLAGLDAELAGPVEELPALPYHVAHLRFLALLLGGDVRAATALVQRRRAEVVATGWPVALGVAALAAGQLARAAGAPAAARAPLREACARLDGGRAYWGPIALAELAAVAALEGRALEAEELHGRALAVRDGAVAVARPLLDLVRPWVVAAGHGQAAGAAAAVATADACAEQGVGVGEVVALHDAVRLGGAARVVDRFTGTGSRFARLAAAHARAHAGRDAAGLLDVASGFRGLGLLLHAAEATAQAADVLAGQGRDDAARAATRRAAALADRCPGADTPALRGLRGVAVPRLTPREREVGGFAADGLPSREIAARLGTSVRTVDNHLGSVYAKLGVPGRAGLAEAFGRTGGDRG